MELAGFQNPWALSLLPLAAVPWILHLMRRRRFRRVPFPSLMLLAEQRTMVWRRYRLEELLLLAVRTVLVTALVAMLARPMVRGNLPGWLSTAERWVVVVLDDSASMAAGPDGATAMDAAKKKLSGILEGMGAAARVAVVGGGRGTPMLAGFGDAGAAVRAVEAASPRRIGTDLAGAVALADRMLGNAKSPLIIIASDFQECSLDGDPDPLGSKGSGSAVLLVEAGTRPAPPNLTWRAVRQSALSGRLAVEGRWTGHGPAGISLLQGGKLVHRTEVMTDGSGDFAFGIELPTGDSVCLVSGEDGLALDDTFFLGGRGARLRRCLVVAEAGTPGQAILAKALESLGNAGYKWRRVALPLPGELREADVILVAARQLGEQLAVSIAEAAGPGKGVLLIPPEEGDPSQYNRLLAALGSGASLSAMVETGTQPIRLGPGPRAAALGWDARMAQTVQVRKYWRASAGGPSALIIGGKDPGLVLEDGPRCRWVLFLAGIDLSMSDLSCRPVFPVMLHRSLEYAAEWLPQTQKLAGDTLRTDNALGAEMVSPGGKSGERSRDGRSDMWTLAEPGWYTVKAKGDARLTAANLPPEESNLEPVAPERLSGLTKVAVFEGIGRDMPAQPVWKALLLMALLLLAAETGLRMGLAVQKNG